MKSCPTFKKKKDACLYSPSTNSTTNDTYCNDGYEGVKCGVCSVGYHKTGNDMCTKCMGDDPFISRMLYTGSLVGGMFFFFLFFYLHMRDQGLAFLSYFSCCLYNFIKCCGCCHNVFCKCCCLKKKIIMTEEEKEMNKEINARKHAGKRRRGLKKGENVQDSMNNATVWFRPEKYKILLSFLQVFQEFRSTYRIKWPVMVEEYMEVFSGLVDFDVFRLTAVDCIYPYTYLHKVWFVVVFPTGCLILLIFCHLIGRHVRSKALRLNARIIDGMSTGFEAWPPRKPKKRSRSIVERKLDPKSDAAESIKRGIKRSKTIKANTQGMFYQK